MASIIKRKSKYSVVYYCTDENGEKRQHWETWNTHQEAKKRKAEVEHKINEGTFVPPSAQTVSEFLYDFVALYGEKKWGVSAYDSNMGLIGNYINPLIGNVPIQEINPKSVDEFYKRLQKTNSVVCNNRKPKSEYVTASVVEKVHKLLKCAFTQAVRWELLSKNPFEHALTPKVYKKRREIWTPDMISNALKTCKDSKLYIAMTLSFACSLRVGEVLGLTWDNIHISDAEIVSDEAYIFIDKELQRCSKKTMETLYKKDIIKVFPPLMPNTSTRVVLKTPKTESSVRKVYLPKTTSYLLQEWKKGQDELKEFLGDEYTDNNLVIALPNGRPCENRVLQKSFETLRKEAGLPDVVFHSLRHSSATYKLKLSHGDLKSVEGDGGWASSAMVTEIYSHILDEDRKVNAQKFEASFYANLHNVKPPAEPDTAVDLQALVTQLKQSPELADALRQILNQNTHA